MLTPRLALPLLACLLGCATAPKPAAPGPTVDPEPESDPAEPQPQAGPRHYRGAVSLPGDRSLEFFVALQPEGESMISIPAQGLFGAALSDVLVSDAEVAFGLKAVGASWRATVADAAIESCAFSQSGVELSCTLEPIDAGAYAAANALPRPQTPEPPFPYDQEEVAYDNEADGIHLEGTLTMPKGAGPHPAALMITGSGAQDRDETIMGHKPFAVIADHLTREGIAVLRVDDRGVGGSTGSVGDSTGSGLTRDAQAGVAFLRSHDRIDPGKIGVIGHSEGGAIGPRVAADDAELAFVVMLAGPGVPGHEILRLQTVEIARASGVPEGQLEVVRKTQNATVDAMMEASTLEEAKEAAAAASGGAGVERITPWFLDFLAYDPAPTLRRVKCPVLVLNGELDLQVLPDQNLPTIEAALRHNRRVEVRRLPGLNHLFQPAQTGAPSEYAQIEQTIDPQVLELMAGWVGHVTKK